jgi:hypothetical protein
LVDPGARCPTAETGVARGWAAAGRGITRPRGPRGTSESAQRPRQRVGRARRVGDQAAAGDIIALGVDRRQPVPGRQRDDQLAMSRRGLLPRVLTSKR